MIGITAIGRFKFVPVSEMGVETVVAPIAYTRLTGFVALYVTKRYPL